jgi:transposase InsO family protein
LRTSVATTAKPRSYRLIINGLYKAELTNRRAPWKKREAVQSATLEWVTWFNQHRLLEPLGYIPPAEAEANYY